MGCLYPTRLPIPAIRSGLSQVTSRTKRTKPGVPFCAGPELNLCSHSKALGSFQTSLPRLARVSPKQYRALPRLLPLLSRQANDGLGVTTPDERPVAQTRIDRGSKPGTESANPHTGGSWSRPLRQGTHLSLRFASSTLATQTKPITLASRMVSGASRIPA